MATPPTPWPADVGRWSSEAERGFENPRTAWWWQAGPVTSCCGCFAVRTGIYLLSLWDMFRGMNYVNVEKWTIPMIIQKLKTSRSSYEEFCLGVVVKQELECDAYLRAIAESERSLAFASLMVPAYRAVGALHIFFSLAGWRAAYTNNTTFAKLFMLGFTASFSFEVCRDLLSPDVDAPLNILLNVLLYAYFFKVSWSFYKRLTIAEQARRIVAEGRLEEGGAAFFAGRSPAAAVTSSSTVVRLGTR